MDLWNREARGEWISRPARRTDGGTDGGAAVGARLRVGRETEIGGFAVTGRGVEDQHPEGATASSRTAWTTASRRLRSPGARPGVGRIEGGHVAPAPRSRLAPRVRRERVPGHVLDLVVRETEAVAVPARALRASLDCSTKRTLRAPRGAPPARSRAAEQVQDPRVLQLAAGDVEDVLLHAAEHRRVSPGGATSFRPRNLPVMMRTRRRSEGRRTWGDPRHGAGADGPGSARGWGPGPPISSLLAARARGRRPRDRPGLGGCASAAPPDGIAGAFPGDREQEGGTNREIPPHGERPVVRLPMASRAKDATSERHRTALATKET